MLARVAACAASFFVWSVSAEIHGRALPFPRVAVAAAQEMAQEQVITAPDQNVDAERKTRAAPRQDASTAAPSAGAEPASANQAVSFRIALAPEAAPFGLATERVYDGEILRKWTDVKSEIREDKQILARCRKDPSWCPLAAQRFLAIVDEGRARSGRARIGVINRAINLAIIPTSDLVQWGVVDRWSAPLETFTTRRGDCEDYAIAKYVALRAAGVAPEDIKLVVVRNTDISENHAVVAVRLDGAWVILDNRSLALVPDREVWRATPVFEIDEDGVRQFLTPIANARLQEGGRGAVSTTVPARR
jgi:predicted transglutaminase-like cysteine proteinase